ncbi:sulfatase-like hydrolase/transferase [uncultured Winogradskyella sp.]|uniref:sulfatase-like hydrolase/transferase n=1 Tax=uncultured Winogradskyella sp. TaxID=395353 RepID=UPI0026262CA5|nr:sulfatase-like hydrolase/transferase [uncultured Winogradskyella sp.]
MVNRLKKQIDNFINSENHAPYLAALISGLTPMLFYYANNYWAVNSWSHLLFFSLVFIGSSFLIYTLLYLVFAKNQKFKKNTKYLLLIVLLCAVFVFLSHTFFVSPLKRIVLITGLVVLGLFFWKRPKKNYKKVIIFLFFFSSLSFFRVIVHLYEDVKPEYWTRQDDDIMDVKFKSSPNIYLIQPDGYVSQSTLEKSPYDFKSDLYLWLEQNEFKVYDNFRSNYPASLTSNASLFAMKQHKFANMLFPEIEMANAREVISTSNPVASIFKNNNYTTYFIAQDEYFQQNRKQQAFDYFNIALDDFPFYSKGDEEVRDVFVDLKLAMKHQNENPKFFFIEKLLPHHVGFPKIDDVIIKERNRYNERIEDVNTWLKSTISYITDKDENSIIIILADHGGWVGLKSFNDLYSNTETELINSTFSNIAAIKWNGNLEQDYDKDLKTNVNLFRVLFSALSKDKKYLKHLEDDSSYNLRLNSFGFKSVEKLINDQGDILN